MSIEVIGDKEIIAALRKLDSGITREIKGIMLKLGHETRTEWQQQIRSMKIVDTGRYHGSIEVHPDMLDVEIGTDVDYAIFQEYGTRRIKPRPAMGVTALKMEKRIDKEVGKVVDKEFRKI